MKTSKRTLKVAVVDIKPEPHALTRALAATYEVDRSLLPRVGAITITRPDGDHCDYMEIDLTDDSSGITFATVRVKYAQMMLALTARSHTPMTFEVRGLKLIGTKHEHKTESVPFKGDWTTRRDEEVQTEALAPFEVDGWKGRREDLTNGHNSNHDGTQTVHFSRHVGANGKPVAP